MLIQTDPILCVHCSHPLYPPPPPHSTPVPFISVPGGGWGVGEGVLQTSCLGGCLGLACVRWGIAPHHHLHSLMHLTPTCLLYPPVRDILTPIVYTGNHCFTHQSVTYSHPSCTQAITALPTSPWHTHTHRVHRQSLLYPPVCDILTPIVYTGNHCFTHQSVTYSHPSCTQAITALPTSLWHTHTHRVHRQSLARGGGEEWGGGGGGGGRMKGRQGNHQHIQGGQWDQRACKGSSSKKPGHSWRHPASYTDHSGG